MILNETVAAIADAIREKTGKSELIAPIDFASEIKGISAGGESGGSDEWQYFDVRNNTIPEGQWILMMTMLPTLVAIKEDDGVTSIISGAGILAMYGVEEAKKRLKYIAIDMDVKQYSSMTGNQLMSFKEIEHMAPSQSIASMLASVGCTPITKEQFYDLNA